MNKRICILGSGLVSSSVVNFFCRDPNYLNLYTITVGSIVSTELDNLRFKYPNIKTVLLDVTVDKEILVETIKDADIVVSLLTNEMQVPIAKTCIGLRVNMLHASYCTKEMMELDAEAKRNGVTILNELGLDPGIDHLLAMKAIDEIRKEEGTKITAFISYCGGLPEPKISNCNPLRYKFSWSPLTSLRNMLNSARYLKDNEVVEIPVGGSLIEAIEASSDNFMDELIQLEAYPNRDSLIYKELYGIQEASTIIRGTYRYRGFKDCIKTLLKLGFFSEQSTKEIQEKGNIQTWADLIATLTNSGTNTSSLQEMLYREGYHEKEVANLEKLGLLSDTSPVRLRDTLLETLAEYLTDKLRYEPNERDMVIMRHEIRYIKQTDGESCETLREILFLAYGEQDKNGFSAMSKTVGLTIGHAANLMLRGTIQETGVIYPFKANIYNPILDQLKKEGLCFIETERQRMSVSDL